MMDSNESLVKLVKSVGQEIIERAEDLVGTGDAMSGFNIYIDMNFPDGIPVVSVTREYMSIRSRDIIFNVSEDEQLLKVYASYHL